MDSLWFTSGPAWSTWHTLGQLPARLFQKPGWMVPEEKHPQGYPLTSTHKCTYKMHPFRQVYAHAHTLYSKSTAVNIAYLNLLRR